MLCVACMQTTSSILQAALKRLRLDYVDLIFCHRPDTFTPIEETVRAMNFVIEQGWAFYWGTSEWTAQQITEVQQFPTWPWSCKTEHRTCPSVVYSDIGLHAICEICHCGTMHTA